MNQTLRYDENLTISDSQNLYTIGNNQQSHNIAICGQSPDPDHNTFDDSNVMISDRSFQNEACLPSYQAPFSQINIVQQPHSPYSRDFYDGSYYYQDQQFHQTVHETYHYSYGGQQPEGQIVGNAYNTIPCYYQFPTFSQHSLPKAEDQDQNQIISQKSQDDNTLYVECENIDVKGIQIIVSHLQQKQTNKAKKQENSSGQKVKVKYGNDQLVKKIVRKMGQEYARQFRDYYEEIKSIEQAVEALKNYLIHSGIPEKWIDTESEDFKVMKQFLLPLNAKRMDRCFGQIESKRGQNARNDFLSKGTKKEGIKFFSNRLAYTLMWKDFNNVCEGFVNLEECSDKEKVEIFLKHLREKLSAAKTEKQNKMKQAKKIASA